ncbi:MAG TPA: hypothetical protein DIT33_09685 [Pseudomonas sp.]|nr:hypothetical protein [Pseudomonas sp.]
MSMSEKKNSPMSQLGVSASRQQLLSETFDSVFDIAAQPLARLLATDPKMHISEARPLLQQAKVLAAHSARQFREQRLTTSIRNAYPSETGVKGLIDGPTYTGMFDPDWAAHCPPDAIEATTSPIAYLADLYREALTIEDNPLALGNITLAQRRPDLAELILDHTALNQIEPTLVLVNDILETSIRTYLDEHSREETLVDDVLLQARYPQTLPYERYQQQINYVLGRKQRSPGDVIRCIDPAYPYFKEPGAHSLHSDEALQQDTGFGPEQQSLLLEAPHYPDTGSPAVRNAPRPTYRINPRSRLIEDESTFSLDFFKTNYGLEDPEKLLDSKTFCLQTGLSSNELDSLLSVGPYAPTQSPNAGSQREPIDGAVFGSVYVNGGQSQAIAIEAQLDDQGNTLSHRLINCSYDQFDRMNRMIRLARWLDLPFDQVDRLLTASIAAEQKNTPLLITTDTLRSLGVFQRLRATHKITVDDFATLLNGLATLGRGKDTSQFDLVFNSQALFPQPLILDNSELSITPNTDAERQKVDHLCAALGMTYETYRFTAKLIQQAQNAEPLRWSTTVVSAFYRLTRLPRYLGLSTIEALALLELLDNGGSKLVSKLAGRTHIITYQTSANSDTLSTIHALADCTTWLSKHKWTVSMLCRAVLPALTSPVATDSEYNLLHSMSLRLQSALITDSSFAEANAPTSALLIKQGENGKQLYENETIDWFGLLYEYIDAGDNSNPASSGKGLVIYHGEDEDSFEVQLSDAITWILDTYKLPDELHSRLVNMIMRARGVQEALLLEGLADYLTVSTDLTKTLLIWAGGNRYDMLKEVCRVSANISERPDVPIGDDVLKILNRLAKLAHVTNHLSLSPILITQLCEHPEWFGLSDTRLSLRCVYILTQYTQILSMSEQGEDQLLNYFRLINNAWTEATESDKVLIRDSAANKLATLLQWGVREVLTVAFHLNPDHGVVFTLPELDLMVRVCQLCRQTGLDAKALLALGNLTPTSSLEEYRGASEQALSCLTDDLPNKPSGEVGQSQKGAITVINSYLIANNPSDQGATLTLTLQDLMDQPREDITIKWSTNIGAVEPDISLTDRLGQASITLKSGAEMGLAHVVAKFGLDETILAPEVTIGCDEDSLEFFNPSYTPSSALSNNLEAIEFTVSLKDIFGNCGADRAIEWGTNLGQFHRHTTRTNASGESTASLRSDAAGPSTVIAQYNKASPLVFDPVTFTSTPYFEYVRFDNPAVIGFEVELSCRVVELNGDPVSEPQTIAWSADTGTILVKSSKTDINGIAKSRFKSDATGTVIITASAGDAIQDKNSASTTIHPQVQIARSEASSDSYVTGSPDPIDFYVWLESDSNAAPRTTVSWSINDGISYSSVSDKNGMATFSSKSFPLGSSTIKATVTGSASSHDFTVVCTPEFHEIVFSIPPGPIPGRPELLPKNVTHIINIKAVDKNGAPVEGVPCTLSAKGIAYTIPTSLSDNRIRISHLGTTFTSQKSGTDITLDIGIPIRQTYAIEYLIMEIETNTKNPVKWEKIIHIPFILFPYRTHVESGTVTIEYRIGYKDSVYDLQYNYNQNLPQGMIATIPNFNESIVCNFIGTSAGTTNAFANGPRFKPGGEWTPDMEVHVSGSIGYKELTWAMEGTVTGLAATNTHGEDQ